ncbi:hypothetical protein Sta7437_4890 (plasmid) [Stanieria cyanosphaera PCC 7437]|uniref:Uncharacterized protein n=2 Tax=Stanieria cyanosphaera TaxID=102116 RepID=K9Y0P9_STAC7|nr:hypothetical protein Sta7437_4890 [Stanieria cyanosphaera PCC 7437]
MIKRRDFNAEPIRLGIWGVSESGKTVYLAKLYRMLLKEGWKIRISGDYKDFLEQAIEKLDNRELPNATNTSDEQIKTCQYRISNDNFQETGKKVQAVIDFFDIAGEYYGGENKIRYREELRINLNGEEVTLIDYLLSCDGILFLLDYWRNSNKTSNGKSQLQLLEELFREMFERREYLDSKVSNRKQNNSFEQLESYVVFAVTKADHEDIENSGMSSIELVSKVLNFDPKTEDIINWFDNYFYVDKSKLARQIDDGYYEKPSKFHRCQFFAVSAIGSYYDEKSGRSKSGVIIPEKPNPDPQERKSDDVFSPKGDKVSNPSDRFGGRERKDRNQKPKPQILKGVRLEPMNVVEPIEWFIEGILKNPPKLPSIHTNTPTPGENEKE